MACDVAPVPRQILLLDLFAENLGQQNMRDGVQDAFRRSFQQIGETHVQLALAHADRVVYIGEGIELDPHLGQGNAWPKFAVAAMKDFREFGAQRRTKLSRAYVETINLYARYKPSSA